MKFISSKLLIITTFIYINVKIAIVLTTIMVVVVVVVTLKINPLSLCSIKLATQPAKSLSLN
jgi:hypothetical protein